MTPPPAENFAARIFIGPALRAQPDRRLVDLVRNGYDAAFEEIVRRYRRPLDRFAAAIVGGRSEDVTQDAFSKALPALRGSEAEIDLRPWLYRIVRNTALNDLRDQAPAATELSEALPGGRSAAAEAEAREELTELMDRLRALPEPQRAALVMRELEGLSHEEIAAALGVSGGAARQAIYRARAALRDGLGLLLPMPVLRALVEHGDVAAASGAVAAGAGASTAGGAALGGLGGGAVKAGIATVLVAGTVGAGVAVQHERGREGPEPAAAEAAVSPKDERGISSGSNGSPGPEPSDLATDSGGRESDDGDRGSEGHRRESDDDGRRGQGEPEGDHGTSGHGRSGPGGRSGHRGPGQDNGHGGRGHSGKGTSGSGHSGSGGRGSGSGSSGRGSGGDDSDGVRSGSGPGGGGEEGHGGGLDSSGSGKSGSSPSLEASPPPSSEPPPSDPGDAEDGGDSSGKGSGSGSSGGLGSEDDS